MANELLVIIWNILFLIETATATATSTTAAFSQQMNEIKTAFSQNKSEWKQKQKYL